MLDNDDFNPDALTEALDQLKSAAADKKLTPCELTPPQQRMWTEVRTGFLWSAPAFSSLLYSMMADRNGDTAYFSKDVPICATDGERLIINPDGFFAPGYTLDNRIFATAHEVCHAMLAHCEQMHTWKRKGELRFPDGTTLPYVQETMDVATDLVVNDLLVQSRIGTIHPDWFHDPNLASANDSVLDAYAKVYKKQKEQEKGRGGGGHGPSGTSFDQHLDPGTCEGKSPEQAKQDRNDTEWQTQIAAAAQAAQLQGKLPAALQRFLKELMEPAIDWTDHLRQTIIRRLGNDTRSWRKLGRRMIVRDIGAPGKVGYGCGLVVVAIDTSGSITDETINMFMTEVRGILDDVRPEQVAIVWCDAKVQRVDEACDTGDLETIRAKGAPGGGGTSFVPVFDHIEEEGLAPDALLYLTDGYGTFPECEPDYPTVWGSISKGVEYPFGEVVEIPQQARVG